MIVLIALTKIPTYEDECMKSHRLDKRRNPDIAERMGHGEASTR